MGVGRSGLTNSASGVLKKKDNIPRRQDSDGFELPELPEFAEAQDDLENIPGTPFYHTPNTPADPTDCNRYPNSPWCGETSGFNLDSAFDFGFTPVWDECNIGFEFAPTFGFISLPTFQFVYRFPGECRLPPPKPILKPPLEPERKEKYLPPGKYLFIKKTDFRSSEVLSYPQAYYGETDFATTTFDFSYSSEISAVVHPLNASNIIVGATLKADTLLSRTVLFVINFTNSFAPYENYSFTTSGSINTYKDSRAGWGSANKHESSQDLDTGSIPQVAELYFNVIIEYFPGGNFTEYARFSEVNTARDNLGNPIYRETKTWGFEYIALPLENYSPAPPPPEDKCKCMCRCDNKNNEKLLRLILKRIGNLPANVPTQLSDRSKGMTNINSLSEFIAHTIRQIDAVAGYFPIEIKIEDADLTKEGNQEKTVKMPNIAETLAEIMGLLLALRAESDANLNATIRALIEVGSTKQTAIETYYLALANSEFLSYKQKKLVKEVPFTFTPGKEKLDELLKETKVKVQIIDNDDKDDIKKLLYPLFELAARWNAQNYRNLGTSSPKDRLKEILGVGQIVGDAADLYAKYQQGKNEDGTNKPPKEDDFDNFLEDAETGFNTQSGISNPDSPYGYPYENRPRFRQIGNTSDD